MSKFHRRAVLVAGAGFFTDAYDLFVISTVGVLVGAQWHLSTSEISWVEGAAILGAFIGALAFGRIADLIGRRRVFALVAAVMIVGAVASAFATDFVFLVVARVVLGLGIGGDYPVSAVLMSEYANRRDRGRLVGLVFSMQAVGLVVGPVVAIALLGSGVAHGIAWRVLLGLGALPAAGVLYLRIRMPESPRFQARTSGVTADTVRRLERYSGAAIRAAASVDGSSPQAGAQAPAGTNARSAVVPSAGPRPSAPAASASIRWFLTNRRMLVLLLGTAGGWFLFDYAYYGNTLSLPVILKSVDPGASLIGSLALSLVLFVAFAVPGYVFAVWKMDSVGHRRLQLLGFSVMAAVFLALGLFGPLTSIVAPFIALFGVSYFFVEFGPNTTTFVLPSEVFPTRVRTTGHGVAAGLGKLGAFVGVFLVPALEHGIGLRGMLLVAAGASAAGFALTTLLPEPGRRSLDEVTEEAGQHDLYASDVTAVLDGAGVAHASSASRNLGLEIAAADDDVEADDDDDVVLLDVECHVATG